MRSVCLMIFGSFLIFNNSSMAMQGGPGGPGGGGSVTVNEWGTWILDGQMRVDPLNAANVELGGDAEWDLDSGTNPETVYLDGGADQDSDAFTGDKDGDLDVVSVEAKGSGAKSFSLYVGGGMTVQLLDSLTLSLPDEMSIDFSRQMARLRPETADTYDVKYRYIVENEEAAVADLPVVKVFIEDDSSSWQEVAEWDAGIGLQGHTYFETQVEGAVNKDWLKGTGQKYFSMKIELWDNAEANLLDTDYASAYVQ